MGYLSKNGYTTSTVNGALDGAVTVNESGNSVDFRVETNNQANAFLVDGSADSVKIGYNETIVPSAEPASASNVLHNVHLGLAILTKEIS